MRHVFLVPLRLHLAPLSFLGLFSSRRAIRPVYQRRVGFANLGSYSLAHTPRVSPTFLQGAFFCQILVPRGPASHSPPRAKRTAVFARWSPCENCFSRYAISLAIVSCSARLFGHATISTATLQILLLLLSPFLPLPLRVPLCAFALYKWPVGPQGLSAQRPCPFASSSSSLLLVVTAAATATKHSHTLLAPFSSGRDRRRGTITTDCLQSSVCGCCRGNIDWS